MRVKATCLLLAMAAGCGGKKSAAGTEPAPASAAVATTRFTGFAEVDLEGGNAPANVPDDVFAGISVAAAGWAKASAGSGSVGVFYPDGASEPFKRALDAVATRYAWRPITKNEFGMVCGRGSRSLSGATCAMRYVTSVMQLRNLRIKGDSGHVGLSVSKVPSGTQQIETITYCVTLEYQGTGWVARRGERVVNARLCPRPPSMP